MMKMKDIKIISKGCEAPVGYVLQLNRSLNGFNRKKDRFTLFSVNLLNKMLYPREEVPVVPLFPKMKSAISQ